MVSVTKLAGQASPTYARTAAPDLSKDGGKRYKNRELRQQKTEKVRIKARKNQKKIENERSANTQIIRQQLKRERKR